MDENFQDPLVRRSETGTKLATTKTGSVPQKEDSSTQTSKHFRDRVYVISQNWSFDLFGLLFVREQNKEKGNSPFKKSKRSVFE
jgi:hypothetical protein